MRRWLLLVLMVVVGFALYALPLVHAQGAEPPSSAAASLALTSAGGDATVRFPFALQADGQVYAKLLPTPWNPVLPSGATNGSVAADRSAGLKGWWVQLSIEPAGSAPVPLGAFADGGASQAVLLPGGQTHALVATVHAPANAGPAGADYRVDLALAHRDAAQGATDAAWTLTARLHVASAQAVGLDAGMVWVLLGAAGAVALGAACVAAVRRFKPERPGEWL